MFINYNQKDIVSNSKDELKVILFNIDICSGTTEIREIFRSEYEYKISSVHSPIKKETHC